MAKTYFLKISTLCFLAFALSNFNINNPVISLIAKPARVLGDVCCEHPHKKLTHCVCRTGSSRSSSSKTRLTSLTSWARSRSELQRRRFDNQNSSYKVVFSNPELIFLIFKSSAKKFVGVITVFFAKAHALPYGGSDQAGRPAALFLLF